MSPEAQRIAIAEACGWTRYFPESTLPDYLSDLNAMHEAEKVLTPEQGWEYAQNLVVDGGRGWFATAAQRAEAFLRTLNLWEAIEPDNTDEVIPLPMHRTSGGRTET
jgi:hypothetical protein